MHARLVAETLSGCLFSRSGSLDRGWDSLRQYVEEVQHVNQDDEPTFFDEFVAKALQEQMDSRCALPSTP